MPFAVSVVRFARPTLWEDAGIPVKGGEEKGYLQSQEGKGDNFARIKMNVVMQLKEGTDFVMSFSIE